MKKFLILLLSFVMVVFCAACGTFTPPIETDPDSGLSGPSGNTPGGDNPDNPDPDDPDDPDDPVNPGQTGYEFSVTLVTSDGSPFPVKSDMDIKAAWSGVNNESHSEPFGADGTAKAKGLDGTYLVSLTNVPDNYTYDPNVDSLIVNNYRRDVTITLVSITNTKIGRKITNFTQDAFKDRYNIRATGTYRAVINKEGDSVAYLFNPSQQGKYIVQSWVNARENEVNPIMDVYYPSQDQYINDGTRTRYSTGGKSNSFTKNFLWDGYERASGVSGTAWLNVYCEVKEAHPYPVYIDFTVVKLGEASDEWVNVEAKGRFNEDKTLPFNGAPEYKHTIYEGEPNKMLDGSKVRLNWNDTNNNGVWDETDGGDGYYHVVLPEAIQTDGTIDWAQCPVLYVAISTQSEVIDTPKGFLNHTICDYVDSNKNKCDPGGNEKYFLNLTNSRGYFKFVHQYAEHAISGYHPVTPELKTFLEDYAKYNRDGRFFDDGYGVFDGTVTVSGPDGIWLYACYYFSEEVLVKNK